MQQITNEEIIDKEIKEKYIVEDVTNNSEIVFLLKNVNHMLNNISKKVDSIEFELGNIKDEITKLKNYSYKNNQPHYR